MRVWGLTTTAEALTTVSRACEWLRPAMRHKRAPKLCLRSLVKGNLLGWQKEERKKKHVLTQTGSGGKNLRSRPANAVHVRIRVMCGQPLIQIKQGRQSYLEQ